MNELNFDPDNTLAGGLYAMTPREAVDLAIALCDAVERAVGADGCHGGVWPGNITSADGQVALGPAEKLSIAEMSPSALEYVAPEQFWSGTESPAADVYSIGLVLYTALNRGVMPFMPAEGSPTSSERAAALQNRMKGKALPYPATAGRELGDAVLKALSFKATDRYETPGKFKAALLSLPEEAAIPAAAPVLPLSRDEVETVRSSYRVDKDFEPTEPEKPKKTPRVRREAEAVDEDMDVKEFRRPKKKGGWVLPAALAAVIVVAIVLLARGCKKTDPDDNFPIETDPIHSPVPVITTPVPEETPEPTPEPTETPEPTAEPTETPEYEIFLADVTWEQAKDLCEQKGGHLATVRSQEELDSVTALAEANGAQFVWLGAYRGGNDTWYYVTGDKMTFAAWDTGEPSARDSDGTPENYLLLWYRPAAGAWSYNDMRNDPISVVPRTYSGKTAYVCQYD